MAQEEATALVARQWHVQQLVSSRNESAALMTLRNVMTQGKRATEPVTIELRIASEEHPIWLTEPSLDVCNQALKQRRVGDEDLEVDLYSKKSGCVFSIPTAVVVVAHPASQLPVLGTTRFLTRFFKNLDLASG